MKMRFFLSILCLFFVVSLNAQRDFGSIEIETHKVAGSVYMLEGSGGNIGVSAGPDGILIVDDQFAPLAEKIRSAFSALSTGDLKFILNTHWHGDHTGGNVVFGPEAPIIAHENVRERLRNGMDLPGRQTPPAPPEAWPVVTFEESVSIHFNGEEIEVIHYPHGHTDGDSVIYFTESNVVHMGDHFFHDRFPYVDLESGGTVSGLIRNIEAVLKRVPSDVKIIPGHGPLATRADLREYHEMLLATTELIREKMLEGESLQAIQASDLLDSWSSWGEGFISGERWIQIVYRSLIQ